MRPPVSQIGRREPVLRESGGKIAEEDTPPWGRVSSCPGGALQAVRGLGRGPTSGGQVPPGVQGVLPSRCQGWRRVRGHRGQRGVILDLGFYGVVRLALFHPFSVQARGRQFGKGEREV